jgi:hypothetical protein
MGIINLGGNLITRRTIKPMCDYIFGAVRINFRG